MLRVNTKTKNSRGKEVHCGKCGVKINPGDKYLKWSFRFGGDRFRCTKPGCRPRGSDLTMGQIGNVYSLNERLEDACATLRKDKDFEAFKSEMESIKDDADSLKEEFESSKENLPEQFQEVGAGETLTNRIEALEEFVSELDSAIDNADWPGEKSSSDKECQHEGCGKTSAEHLAPSDEEVDHDFEAPEDKEDIDPEDIISDFESLSCDCD